MTHHSLQVDSVHIVQIDSVINRLASQEKFFRDLLPSVEIYNFPDIDSALPIIAEQSNLFKLIIIHESCISDEFQQKFPNTINLVIVTELKIKPNTKIHPKSINFINSPFKKSWFEPIFEGVTTGKKS
ncbi:MAG: hypothetical protein MH472_03040 [Bacteroidia bacterium]|nr:hypothetical protein [Bacteroidia bacterium]